MWDVNCSSLIATTEVDDEWHLETFRAYLDELGVVAS